MIHKFIFVVVGIVFPINQANDPLKIHTALI